MKCTICGKEMKHRLGVDGSDIYICDCGNKCFIPADNNSMIQQGWQCSKCGSLLAPHQNYCPFCASGMGTITNPRDIQISPTNTTVTGVAEANAVGTLYSETDNLITLNDIEE